MKKLEYAPKERQDPGLKDSGMPRRGFIKAVAAAGAVLAFGLVDRFDLSGSARAQTLAMNSERKYKLDRTLNQLRKEMVDANYNTNEILPSPANGNNYHHGINTKDARFVVVFRGTDRTLIVGNSISQGTLDLSKFIGLVQDQSSTPVAKVKFVIEKAPSGRGIQYTSAYIFALDKRGNELGKTKDGYLVYAATSMDGKISGGTVVISEPPTALARK